jgi:XTP/dITP diphosphohydrolase
MNLLVATKNPHKSQEIEAILGRDGIQIVTLLDRPDLPEPEENGATLRANALAKAREIHGLTGLPTLADDSGLEVDALDGAPGVHSKRFTPEATAEANNRHLVERLQGVARRSARFRCVVALVTSHFEGVVEGRCEGQIGETGRGTFGFGYDPLFLPDETPGRTMAELTAEEKNSLSHRARALAGLDALLREAGLRA